MKKQFLYIAFAPTYGKDYLVKIGISNDPQKRITSLKKSTCNLIEIYKTYKFNDINMPVAIECAVVGHFYNKPYIKYLGLDENYNHTFGRYGREFFSCDPREVQDFVELKIKEYMGGVK